MYATLKQLTPSTREMVLGELPARGVNAVERFQRDLNAEDAPFPCTFAVSGFRRTHLRFAFVEASRTKVGSRQDKPKRGSSAPEGLSAALPADLGDLQGASGGQSGADRPSRSGFPGLEPAFYTFGLILAVRPVLPARTARCGARLALGAPGTRPRTQSAQASGR